MHGHHAHLVAALVLVAARQQRQLAGHQDDQKHRAADEHGLIPRRGAVHHHPQDQGVQHPGAAQQGLQSGQ